MVKSPSGKFKFPEVTRAKIFITQNPILSIYMSQMVTKAIRGV